MTSMELSVRVRSEQSVTVITLNRPDSLNAFNRDMADRLEAALRTIERDDSCRAVIITGAGRGFSAGQDVRELQAETARDGPPAASEQLRLRFNPIVIRLRQLEKPVIAAINGVATGAGLGIALSSDIRIASESATFVLSPISIGFIPAVGSTALLPALIGLGRASEMAFTGERLSVDRALEIGLIQRIVPAESLMDEALAFAHRLSALPTKTIGLTKRAFNRAVFGDLNDHLAYEAHLQEIAASTTDHTEGLRAIIEKDSPAFSGR